MEDLEDILGAVEVILRMNKDQQQAIAEHIKTLKQQDEQLAKMANSLPKIVRIVISDELKATAQVTQSTMRDSITPFLDKLKSDMGSTADRLKHDMDYTASRAADENKLLSQTIRAFSWKWLWVASFATLTASIAGAVILSGYLEIAWHRVELESLRTEKALMVENIAALDKVKGHIKLDTCEGKPCIEVDTKHGYGDSRYQFFWLRSR